MNRDRRKTRSQRKERNGVKRIDNGDDKRRKEMRWQGKERTKERQVTRSERDVTKE